MRTLRLVYLSLVVLLSMAVLPMVTTAQGNSGAAACQEGGYLTVTDAAGNAFKNTGQCVRFVAQGGQLVPISSPDSREITVEFRETDFSRTSCFIILYLDGFEETPAGDPGELVDWWIRGPGVEEGFRNPPFYVRIDDSGQGSVFAGSLPTGFEVKYDVGLVSSGWVPVAC